MADFKVDFVVEDNVLILRPVGYYDKVAGGKVNKICDEQLEAGIKNTLVNFEGAPVINSGGLATIVELVEKCTDQYDGKFGICGISNLVKSAFAVTGLLAMTQNFASEAEGKAAFQKT